MNKNVLAGLIFVAVIAVIGVVAAASSKDGPGEMAHKSDSMPNFSKNSDASPTEVQEGTVAVDIVDFDYAKKTLKVKKGTKVVWTNKDQSQHTVTSDNNGPLQSPRFGKDGTFEYTFNEAGMFSYFCEPHPYMKGAVEVIG